MTRVLLAGGGTAGHVNPLLAIAHELIAQGRCEASEILVLGTAQGLESRLVPEAGLTLATVARLPFPRRLSLYALAFWPRFALATLQVVGIIVKNRVEIVAGFGGYACAPAYVAAWLTRTPCVIHEANSVAGFANRLGARLSPHVAITFSSTDLPGAHRIGMPLARSITHPEQAPSPAEARAHFGLLPQKKTLVVTGGSQGARSVNATIEASLGDLLATGWQVLHIVGAKNDVLENPPKGYVALSYCDRMELAFGAATAMVSRAGAATVSEISLLGIPAIFVPYPVGNGEQEKNARGSVDAGAALMVRDADFTPRYVLEKMLPLLGDDTALAKMAHSAQDLGDRDASGDFVQMMLEALGGVGEKE